ncbi:FG-GAP repeat protein [uncultured Friedmanniella sp.]|uniref:FG-GAP repeat protein n=1 Tax=uncultured Friedmanniella sp. TaxID=335381 RepID=UPI0035CA43D0
MSTTTRAWVWAATFGTALAWPVVLPDDRAWGATVSCQTDVPVVGDVDGDALSDLAVGLPARADAAGAVDLRLTSAASRLLTLEAAGLSPSLEGDRFGSAVALADLNGDGCDDFVVGAPGVTDDAGRIHVVYGAPDGSQTTGGLTEDGGSTPFDRFGSAVAITDAALDSGFHVWVGAPYDDPGAVQNAGSVTHFFVTGEDGEIEVETVETISQATSGVPGTAEVGDHFGAVLTAVPGGVWVGTPDEDVGSVKDAGAVTFLASEGVSGFDTATSWSQASPRVAGGAEAGDHFGAAIGAFDDHAVVGVPGEDVGSRRDAGMLQILARRSALAAFRPVAGLNQDSKGIPGVAEVGDRLGAAVVVGRNIGCFEGVTQLAAGAPGEDLAVGGRSVRDAGTVLVHALTGPDPCATRSDDQQSVLAGSAEPGDQLGSTLGLGRIRDDHDDELGDRVYVGVPGEDRGAVVDAGIVESTAVGSKAGANDLQVAGRRLPSVGFSGGAATGTRYGAVIAAPAG